MRPALCLLALLTGLASTPALAGTFVVNSTGDSGVGTLRWAFEQANLGPGPHRITFNIPGGGVQTIQPLTELPPLYVQVAIDGRTQPGYVSFPAIAGTPLIEIDGTLIQQLEADGIRLFGGSSGSSVRGLALGNFSGYGILFTFTDACTLAACHVGTNAAGTVARPNFIGVELSAPGTGHVIGGPDARSRNVISGNVHDGIRVDGMSDIKIQGNYIGMQANGTASFGNVNINADGIQANDCIRLRIGGLGANEGNLIAGNGGLGINVNNVTGTPAEAHQIYGNKIGTNVYGNAAFSNTWGGISMVANYSSIGHPSAPNVVSGNGPFGLWVGGVENVIQDNFVGTTSDGVNPLGNSDNGITVTGTGHQVLRNVVGGNAAWGIWLSSAIESPAGFIVRGNSVGTNKGGAVNLKNHQGGIRIEATGNLIGGPGAGDPNIVAYNFYGLWVMGGTGNRLERNRLFGNEGIDVDLNGDGTTANDASDPDTGPNDRQNFPVISSVTYGGGVLDVMGTLNTTPNTAVTVHVYSSPLCHDSGYGGGETWVGSVSGMTNGSGDYPFHYSGTSANVAGRRFAAMAIRESDGSTSEFGPCFVMNPVVSVDPISENLVSLGSPWPQPARGTVRIPFSLSRNAQVSLRVYDVAGRRIASLVEGARDPGSHEAEWSPDAFAAGVYQVRLDVRPIDGGERTALTRSVIVVR